MTIDNVKIEYGSDGIPRVNGIIPTYRIVKKTPMYNGSGVIVDYDCELEPTNDAAKVMAQIRTDEERGSN